MCRLQRKASWQSLHFQMHSHRQLWTCVSVLLQVWKEKNLEAELKDLLAKIAEYKEILADKKKLLGVIKQEISLIADKYGDDRRTSIGFDEYDLSMEDLIP